MKKVRITVNIQSKLTTQGSFSVHKEVRSDPILISLLRSAYDKFPDFFHMGI